MATNKKSITIGGKVYFVPEINFSTICELEEHGVDIGRIDKKSFTTIRSMLAWVLKTDVENAAALLENEMVLNETSFNEISSTLLLALGESDFFTKMAKQKIKKAN